MIWAVLSDRGTGKMDYKKILERELGDGHVAFHEYAIQVDRESLNVHYLFFEGDEDPSFYFPHINHRLGGREIRSFVCNGRAEVIKAHSLVSADGRGARRVMFFVDKDHNDLLGVSDVNGLSSVFQTKFYSIENYLVSVDVFKAFWVQRLHLSIYDDRLEAWLEFCRKALQSFWKKSEIISAAILCGRGIDGRLPVRLNLNNVQIDQVFRFDCVNGVFRFQQGAFQHLTRSSNISSAERVSGVWLKKVVSKNLRGVPAKEHVRGKYELWAFWKILRHATQDLSSKAKWKGSAHKRATPTCDLSHASCVESLSPLLACPEELHAFLRENLPPESQVGQVH